MCLSITLNEYLYLLFKENKYNTKLKYFKNLFVSNKFYFRVYIYEIKHDIVTGADTPCSKGNINSAL